MNEGALGTPAEATAVHKVYPAYQDEKIGTVECRVKWKDEERECTDVPCAVLFVLAILTFLALWIALLASSSGMYTLNGDGEITGIADSYLDDAKACCDAGKAAGSSVFDTSAGICGIMSTNGQWSSSRRTGTSGRPVPETVFEGFSMRPECPAVLILILIIICFVWL